jgi:hypothetical protein
MSARRHDLLEAGATIALDSAAVELIELLRERGVRAVVLRGPAIAARLYPDRTRGYEDIDLLVDPAELGTVEEAVRAAGFELAARDTHAAPWIRRADGVNLDLHTTLVGVGASPELVWRELAGAVDALDLGRGEFDVLQEPALALNIALHAAQHGVEGGKSLEDLARALELFPEQTWLAATALATRLDAIPAFATGLRLLPTGAAQAERLGLPVDHSRELTLRAGSPPPTALGFWRLAETRGFAAKARLLARELAPSPAFMRAMYPVARRGPAGLAAAYLWRPVALAGQVGPGFLAWRRARRG